MCLYRIKTLFIKGVYKQEHFYILYVWTVTKSTLIVVAESG